SHSFKLRVTGTKNASSTNTWVVPDRVVITSGAGPTATTAPTRTSTSAPTATAGGAAAWVANHAYAVNDLVTYGGHTYKCIQAHTSQGGWEPPNVPALWQLIA